MKQLAEVMDIHPSSVGRFFKKNTGYTTTEYLNQIRIGYACRLLMGIYIYQMQVLQVDSTIFHILIDYFLR